MDYFYVGGSLGTETQGARMSLNELEVVVDEDGGVTVSPSAVVRLGARPGEHLQLTRSKPGRQSRPKKKVGGILEDKIGRDHITDEDFAAAKAEHIDSVERRFGPPE